MPGEVFISYSRKDKTFVRRLHDALAAAGRNTWIDWEDIPLSADWWQEICSGIEGADAFVFVISPDAARSVTCFKEIDYASDHNKRLMPVLYRDVTDEADKERLHPAVNQHNWIFFREEDDFDAAFKSLLAALDTDLTYAREHTRLLVRARSWESRQRDPSLLLTGSDLQLAEAWLTEGMTKEHTKPTDLHIEYIRESRRAQNRHQQRNRIVTGVVTLIVTLLIISLVQYVRAEDARRKADRNAEEAVAARLVAEEQGKISKAIGLSAQAQLELYGPYPERGVLLALEALTPDKYPYVWQGERALGAAVQASRARRIFSGHSSAVNGVAFSPDGTRIVTASTDNTARVWSVATGDTLLTLVGHTGGVSSVAWSPDGTRIATGSWDRTAKIWDPVSGDPLTTLVGHTDWVTGLAWSPDGTRLITSSADSTAIIWDVASGTSLYVLKGHTGWVNGVAWSPNGKRVVTAGRDSTAPTRATSFSSCAATPTA
jgi:hypothetical protein